MAFLVFDSLLMTFQHSIQTFRLRLSKRFVALLPFVATLILSQSIQIAQGASTDGNQKPITVFAAASLAESLQTVADNFTKATGTPVRLSFAASSALARQIESGAQADVFFSADSEWMDYLQTRALLDTSTRHNVLGNRLVLVAHKDSSLQLKIAPHFPLASAIGKGRLATGDPDSVPVGRYARSALMSVGVWNDVAARLVRVDNVRAAMAYVARGEATLGIVYATDARVDTRVRVIDTFPSDTHLPIVYPIALTRNAASPAKVFVTYVSGKDAALVFDKAGFTFLPANQ
jgi:molybdate transport system substrate-binding protein